MAQNTMDKLRKINHMDGELQNLTKSHTLACGRMANGMGKEIVNVQTVLNIMVNFNMEKNQELEL